MTDSTLGNEATEPSHRGVSVLKSDALKQAMMSSASFPIIATDERGIIQLFNVGAERLLGYPASEVVNRVSPSDLCDAAESAARASGLSRVYGTEISPGFEALAYKASRGIEDVHELTFVRNDGARLPAMVSITPLRDVREAIIGYLLICADNSARKRIAEELEAARALAERANRAKAEFLSSMSHELRSPLGAILGFAQLLESGQPPPSSSQVRSIDQILKAGWYLLELINEVLDLAVVESGTLSLLLEPVSLFEVLYECHAIVEQLARKRDVRVFYPKFVTAFVVKADRMRLKQVLINLLTNAIKYNRHGGDVVVSCAATDAGRIRISVRDTGHGLSTAKLQQLFQPFNRLGQEGGSEQGTGIGLVLCKKLVELMNGQISADSTMGEGSVFSIDLDLVEASDSEPEALDEPVATPSGLAIEPQRNLLLYIEDSAPDLMLVRDLIARRTDFKLLTASDRAWGIEMARSYRPDLILLNIVQPSVSSRSFLDALAEDAITRDIPVIAISAHASPTDMRVALLEGFRQYLSKPIRIDVFMALLDVLSRIKKEKQATTTAGETAE